MKRFAALALALCMLFSLAACQKDETPPVDPGTDPGTTTPDTPKEDNTPQVLNFGQFAMKAPLDRTVGTYIETSQVVDWVYESMYSINPKTGELEPCLAESVETSEDGLTYTFKLRQGVKFHDGTDFTSADVKFSFERLLNPATNSIVGEDYAMITGATAMQKGEATELAGMTCPDDYTVVIKTDYVFSMFMPFVATTAIYPSEACSAAGVDWGNNMNVIGTGPYKLIENNPDAKVTIEKFDGYWGGADKVKVQTVNYKLYADQTTMQLAYDKGDIDVMIVDATQVADYQSKIPDEVFSFDTYGHFFTMMNQGMAPFDDIKVREAFFYAIDVKALTEDLLGGTHATASCLLAPTVMGHENRDVIEYNPEKAKQMLADAGYPNGVEFEAISTNLQGTGGQMMVAMQAQAAPAGFTIKPTQVDRATWTDMRNGGKVPFSIGNWYLGIPEADGILNGFFHSANNKMFSINYISEEYDALVESARTELDEAKRTEIYKAADDMLVKQDFVTVPISWPKSYFLAKTYVKDFEMANSVLPLWDCSVDMAGKK